MVSSKRQMHGMTLLESLLVLALISAILFLGIRQYLSYRTYSEAAKVTSNVDTIFSGLAKYYRTNCYGTVDTSNFSDLPPSAVVTPGTLNAEKGRTDPYPINITNDLTNAGYIETKLMPSALVNPAANAYLAQFNPSPPQIRQVCVDNDTSTSPPTCNTYKQIGTIVSWNAQVSVLMRDTANAASTARLLGATCSSTLNGNFVNPCSANTPGPYAVWERQPSFASSQANSTYWPSTPGVKQFTQMYQIESATISATSDHSTEYQYFYCGN